VSSLPWNRVRPTSIHTARFHGGLTARCRQLHGVGVQSTLDKGFGQTTVEFKISLIRAYYDPQTGRINAEGTVLNCGRRVGTAEGRLTDGKGTLLAHGTTTLPDF